MAAFDHFVVFAEMRTGSNFLEANLNAFDGIACHGEAFNPHFIGYPNRETLLDVTEAQRNADPDQVIAAIKAAPGLNGFRFFHDHDPRVLKRLLDDPRCAKIVLTRNPAESYVSWKIAQTTGQWKLTNVRKRKDGQAQFDSAEFETHLQALQSFQLQIMRALQTSGQTAFYIDNEDLSDVGVMNGLVRWLGVDASLDSLNTSIKRQNPEPLADKVSNYEDMAGALARLDRFNLSRTPNFEPRRGPAVPGYVAPATTPLLYLPIQAGPEWRVRSWFQALDGAEPQRGFSQKALRGWLRRAPERRVFTVLRHPLARAHSAFCRCILTTKEGARLQIRRTLRRAHDLPIPEGEPGADYSLNDHRTAFAAWLRFLKANLSGQTAVRVDGHWATQVAYLQGYAEFVLPDLVLREQDITHSLPDLAKRLGHPAPPPVPQAAPDGPFALAEIYDAELEKLARDAYQRDYLRFGFGDWSDQAA